jgi:small subunit ribosomal protein S19
MTRSIWKGPFSEVTTHEGQQTYVWSRRSMILPAYVGSLFGVHNGKGWVSVHVSEEMIGHKFGEFALTRKKPTHKTNKKKQLAGRKK